MAYKTKLQLIDDKFEQLSGQTLSLSGNTILKGEITVDPRNGIINPLDGVNKAYVDQEVSGATTLSTLYTGASPSNIVVGGLVAGTTLTGRTLSNILQEILITTFTPTFNAPNNSFNDDQANTQEVGLTLNIEFTAGFDQGDIVGDLVGGTWNSSTIQNPRSGGANEFNYTGVGLPASVITTNNSDTQLLNGYTLLAGSNTWTSSVDYDAGPQPLDSDGNNFASPLPAGTTSSKTVSINGIYPYFYGVVTEPGTTPTRPASNQSLIDSGTKVVADSNGTITVPYQNNSTPDTYIWFAIPESSTSKTEWFVTALNNGDISGDAATTTNLFPSADVVSINSPTGLWNGINYKIYVSTYRTRVPAAMELRN